MRKILRFLMLVLMATWGAESYADVVQFKGKDNGYNGTSSFTIANGDITVSISTGVGGSTFTKGDYAAGGTADTMIIPVGCDLTITCNVGYVDYVLFSFNNGVGNINHSYHWTKLSHGTLHKHKSSDGYKDLEHGGIRPYGECYNKGWWGSDGTRRNSVKLEDERTSTTFRKEYKNILGKTKTTQYDEQTTGILWFYVFYTRGTQEHPVVTYPNDFTEDSKSVTLTNNWSGSTMYYTTNGSNPTANDTYKYISAFSLTKTTKIKTLNTLYQKVKKHNGDTKSDDFDENCPDGYTCYSDVVGHTVYQYWPVNLSASAPYTTFCHQNYMRVPTGCVARTYKLENKGNAVYMTSTHDYAAGSLVPPGYTVIVSRASGVTSASGNFENPLDNLPANNTDNTTATTLSDANRAKSYFMGNPSYSEIASTVTSAKFNGNTTATNINNSTNHYYYLMKDSKKTHYGFFFAKSGGGFDGCGRHKAFLVCPTSMLKAKSFIFDLGDDETTGIIAPQTDAQPSADAPMYNTAGQRVGKNYKGLVIQNGRKFIRK